MEPSEAEAFIHRYFYTGNKALALAFQYDALHQLPPERATHTVSGFFLGLLIENCINGANTLAIESQYNFPFSYLWFLTYLYHDYGYCIAENGKLQSPFPIQAPIPEAPYATPSRIPGKEYRALTQIKRILGINLSPFSQSPGFSRAGRHRFTSHPNSDFDVLYELTRRNNRLSGNPHLRLNTGAIIQRPRYSSEPLLHENFQTITYEDNPLLYILVVADSLDPVKVYSQANNLLQTDQIIEAIDIEYTPASRVLSFSSRSSDVDITILHNKAKGLEEWTAARCSGLENSHFKLTL